MSRADGSVEENYSDTVSLNVLSIDPLVSSSCSSCQQPGFIAHLIATSMVSWRGHVAPGSSNNMTYYADVPVCWVWGLPQNKTLLSVLLYNNTRYNSHEKPGWQRSVVLLTELHQKWTHTHNWLFSSKSYCAWRPCRFSFTSLCVCALTVPTEWLHVKP